MPLLTPQFVLPNSERECADRLAELRWGPLGPVCICTCRRFGRLETRPRVFVCRRCKRHKSVTAGTLMHGCHVPLKHWFLASMLLHRVGGCSARDLQRRLKVSYETAWELLHRLRNAVIDPNPMISGRLTRASVAIITCRPYRCGSAAVDRNRSTIAGLMGDHGALFEQLPEDADLGTWASCRGTDEIEEDEGAGAIRTSLRLLRWQVARTHKGVSERWLRRYAGEHQHRHNVRPATFLASSVRARRLRFVEVRPEFEPAWACGFE